MLRVSDESWNKLEAIFSKITSTEIKEEVNSEDETTYCDSLCPTGDNQEYVAKLKEDILNLRREYSRSRKDLGDENLVKRSFLEDMEKTKAQMTKRNTSSNLKERASGNRLNSSIKGDVWFGSGRFQDSGERMRLGGGRRYSESRADAERVKKGRAPELVGDRKNVRVKDVKERLLLSRERVINDSRYYMANDSPGNTNTYKEIMEAVKVNSPGKLSYGKERMAIWLLNSRLQ